MVRASFDHFSLHFLISVLFLLMSLEVGCFHSNYSSPHGQIFSQMLREKKEYFWSKRCVLLWLSCYCALFACYMASASVVLLAEIVSVLASYTASCQATWSSCPYFYLILTITEHRKLFHKKRKLDIKCCPAQQSTSILPLSMEKSLWPFYLIQRPIQLLCVRWKKGKIVLKC